MIEIIQEIFEDADVYKYIKLGTEVGIYDGCAKYVAKRLHKDLTISQIQSLIWESFYQFICTGVMGESFNEKFELDKSQACIILGHPDKFKGLALNIRDIIFGI